MVKGLIYDPGDEEIMKEQFPYLDKLWEFNQLKPSDYEKKQKYMREVFASCGENCYIELPFRAISLSTCALRTSPLLSSHHLGKADNTKQ
jgi:hypothetical protein